MARRKKKKHHEEEAGEAWLLPYSDLMTLLLAVFIVLFAVSKVDTAKSTKMAESFQKTLMAQGAGVMNKDGHTVIPLNPDGSNQGGTSPTDPAASEQLQTEKSTQKSTEKQTEKSTQKSTEKQTEKGDSSGKLGQQELQNMEKLKSKLDDIFKTQGVSASVTTTIDQRGLIISLSSAILFDPGSAVIKTENEDTLIKIATTIDTLHNFIRIEGHTDNQPIHTVQYPSNWELSSARAISVVKLFTEQGDIDPDKMAPVGYGEYRPVADNNTAEGRAKNRRIDIIILSEQYNGLETQAAEKQATQN